MKNESIENIKTYITINGTLQAHLTGDFSSIPKPVRNKFWLTVEITL